MTWTLVLASVFAVHVLAILSPGPNVLVVTQTAMSGARRAGVAAALGIATGAGILSCAALLGVHLVFTHVAWLYDGLKISGGIYLLYLAVRLWRFADRPLGAPTGTRGANRSDGQSFQLGLFTNLTNPKAVVFYGGIFAALVAPSLPLWLKLAAVGVIVVNSAVWHVALACLFSTLGAQRVYQHSKRWIDRGAGAALALLGIGLLIPSR